MARDGWTPCRGFIQGCVKIPEEMFLRADLRRTARRLPRQRRSSPRRAVADWLEARLEDSLDFQTSLHRRIPHEFVSHGVRSMVMARRSASSRRRRTNFFRTSRSTMRLAVEAFTFNRSARSMTRWGPRVSRMMRARYWGNVISTPERPAKLRAAMATRARLAMAKASMSSSSLLRGRQLRNPIAMFRDPCTVQ